MNKELFISAITKVTLGIALIALLIFLPAGTIRFPNGWLLMGILFVPMVIAGFVMMVKNPNLLRSRLKAKEVQSEQSTVIKLSGLMFLAGFLLAGLDFRFGWTKLPGWVPYAGAAAFLIAYALYAEVLRENTWLSRLIEVQEGQQVVSTGLYGVVRHPMYSATLLLFLSMPVVLGSIPAFVIFLAYPAIIVKRIKNEEEVLKQDLPGYAEYLEKVRWRLIPFIW